MSTPLKTPWRIAGEEVNSCNCAWGCPCQFNAPSTHGYCQALIGWQVQEGYFGNTQLSGVLFAWVLYFPGLVHEGNGWWQVIIDEGATSEQRTALLDIHSGSQGGTLFEIFNAICPNVPEPIVAPITLQTDREHRRAFLQVAGVGETSIEPIKNPVTGEEHRARIVIPGGFEYREAEMANSVTMRVDCGSPLVFEHANTYGQLNTFEFSNQ